MQILCKDKLNTTVLFFPSENKNLVKNLNSLNVC